MRADEDLEVPGRRAVVFVGSNHIVAAAAGTPRVIIIDAVTAAVVTALATPAPVACCATWQRGAACLGDVDLGIHVLYLPML
eukprot:gene2153-3811_t